LRRGIGAASSERRIAVPNLFISVEEGEDPGSIPVVDIDREPKPAEKGGKK